jgi:hypothetical protein
LQELFDACLLRVLVVGEVAFDVVEVELVGGLILLKFPLGGLVEFEYLHLQFVFLLVEGDEVVPDLLGRAVVHLLDTVALLRRWDFLVLYYVAVQLLVKRLLRLVPPLSPHRTFRLLLPACRGREVLGLRGVLRAVLFVEGFRLPVFLLVRLDDVS